MNVKTKDWWARSITKKTRYFLWVVVVFVFEVNTGKYTDVLYYNNVVELVFALKLEIS